MPGTLVPPPLHPPGTTSSGWWDPISNHELLRCGYNQQTSEYNGIYHDMPKKSNKSWGYIKLDILGSLFTPNVAIPPSHPSIPASSSQHMAIPGERQARHCRCGLPWGRGLAQDPRGKRWGQVPEDETCSCSLGIDGGLRMLGCWVTWKL